MRPRGSGILSGAGVGAVPGGRLFLYEDMSAVTALSLAVCGHPGPCRERISAVLSFGQASSAVCLSVFPTHPSLPAVITVIMSSIL